jgi:2-polyprenyl-3-methyl-5-hydroxy-6-metoxy-1,4-benzoquinol methylase
MQEIQTKGFNKILNKARAEKLLQYVKGKTCLEIGAGYGQITKYLVRWFEKVTVIEIDKTCAIQIPKYRNMSLICEDFLVLIPTEDKFDTIICTNVLEHVDDPRKFLESIKTWGHENTTYLFSTPNAKSQNRMLGVDMGLIEYPEQLDTHDIAAGHQRLYNLDTLRDEISLSGFYINSIGTFIYKPLPNSLMEKLPNQIIKKCINMKVHENGAEILAVCSVY